MNCCYCNKQVPLDGLRPYGPDGALTCPVCAFSTPERSALTAKMADAALDAAQKRGDGRVVFTQYGVKAPDEVAPGDEIHGIMSTPGAKAN